MKKLIPLSIALLLLFTSCHFTTGSGNIITENRQVGSFTGIDVSNAFDVEVKIGAAEAVRIEADDNIIKYVRTEVSGDKLIIKVENLHSINDAHLKAFVTMPVLNSINASSASDVKVLDVIKGNGRLSFSASSAADIEAEVEAPEVEAEASSSGTVKLSGKTKNYKASASSGSNIKSSDLLSETTEVEVSSGADAAVYASVSLDASASSGGSVNYKGAANVKKDESSGGSVNKKD